MPQGPPLDAQSSCGLAFRSWNPQLSEVRPIEIVEILVLYITDLNSVGLKTCKVNRYILHMPVLLAQAGALVSHNRPQWREGAPQGPAAALILPRASRAGGAADAPSPRALRWQCPSPLCDTALSAVTTAQLR